MSHYLKNLLKASGLVLLIGGGGVFFGIVLPLNCSSGVWGGNKVPAEPKPLSYKIIMIDGCEYYTNSVGEMTFLCHKGNCMNDQHYYPGARGSEQQRINAGQ